VNDHSIIGFQEIKADNLDHTEIQNYDVYFKYRKRNTWRKSGGLALAVKKICYNTVIDSDNVFVLWFKISNLLCKYETDIFCGVVYIPPEYSDYAVDHPFSEIQDDFNRLSDNYASYILFGDFNSRKKSTEDFITVDRRFLEKQNLIKRSLR
jgi:hypothetical protein